MGSTKTLRVLDTSCVQLISAEILGILGAFMSKSLEKQLIQLILIIFILVGFSYALVTPPFEASDELWHYPMIRHLADGNRLPVQVYDPALAGPWKQEASQPPLYYYVGAALTFWIDTADMEEVRWLNPHVNNGVITADGNTNLAIHPDHFSSWRGTLLAIRIVRLFSVLLGGCTVGLTYLIAKEALPDRPDLALGAAALNAFTPMFVFISGAVNNDNLAIPLASLGTLLIIQLVTQPKGRPLWMRAVGIGVVIGAAVLTKQGTIALIPLSFGAFFIAFWQKERGEMMSAEAGLRLIGRCLANAVGLMGVLFIPILLIAGWWYYRNIVLYGDLLGWSAFIAVLGERAVPAPLAQLWDERWGFMLSYWGLFGGVNVPMWEWSYRLLNWILVTSIPGGLFYGVRLLLQRPEATADYGTVPAWLRWFFVLCDWVIAHFGKVVCLLFAFGVVYGLVQWATTTWSSQGRLVFTAMSALCILWVIGLAAWADMRLSRWWLGGVVGLLAILTIVSPWLFIRPTYQPVIEKEKGGSEGCTVDVCLAEAAIFGDSLALLGYSFAAERALPGDFVDLTLQWQATGAEFEQDWSVFIHLNDPVLGVPIAQRDMFLGQGLLPTSILESGDKVSNLYRLAVPRTAVAPSELELVIGLYNFYTEERLLLGDGANHLFLTTLDLDANLGETPNPVVVNFENSFELQGFELDKRRVVAGESIELTLYWEKTAAVDTDYTFFAQILDPDTTRWAAVDLGQPTLSWAEGEQQVVILPLVVRDDAPAGVYPIRIGVYSFSEENGFRNLQRVTEDGRLTDDFLDLTPIRVD